MKRTYTPTLEELSRQYGEQYFTLETGTSSALVFGDLETIVSTLDAVALDSNIVTICSASGRPLVFHPCIIDGPDLARVCPQPVGDTYEIRQIDAWEEYDDHDDPSETPAWTYNETWHMGEFTTTGDVPRAFRRALGKLGVSFYRGKTRTEYDGDFYEIVDRKTGEPLFCAIPQA